MSEFLHMGGHGAFIWSAYGLSAVALIVLILRSRSRAKATLLQVDTMRQRRKENN